MEIDEIKENIDWLMKRDLSFAEASYVMFRMECGVGFPSAILDGLTMRKTKLEELNEKNNNDWGSPITA